MILLVLHDTGYNQPAIGPFRGRDCFSCALVRVNAAEEQQIFTAARFEGEVLWSNAMMNGRRIPQVLTPVGVADRDKMDSVFIGLVGWQDAFGREAMDRGHQRRFHQTRKRE